MRSGVAEFRPVGTRMAWLRDFVAGRRAAGRASASRSAWRSSCTARVTGGVVAMFPSPAGRDGVRAATSTAWEALVAANPSLERLEADVEALIVNRMADPPQYAIAPIDDCYGLVGLIKARWDGISGGDAAGAARSAAFFGELREARGVSAERDDRTAAPPPTPGPTPRSRCSPPRRCGRGRTDAALRAQRDRARAGARSTRSRCPPRSSSSRPSAPTTPRRAARLVELFGDPSAGRRRRKPFLWTQVDVLVPAFTGATGFRDPACRAPSTSSSRRPSTSTRCPTARCRCVQLHRHVFYRGEDGRMQVAQVPVGLLGALPAAGRDLAAT